MQNSVALQRKGIPRPLVLILVLLAISVFINYVDRGNLSIAGPMLKDELGISASQLGILFSAFFCTYAAFQLFSGWLVDRFNVNWIFAGGFFLWSAATAATGIAHAFASILVFRLLVGIGESVAYPSYTKIIASNFAEAQRGFANGVLSAGLVLGPGFGMLFGGLLIARFGWRPCFIVLGLASLIWIIPWLRCMPKETHAIHAGTIGTPMFIELLRVRSLWGTCLGLFCGNYVNYFLITWLPFYLVRERQFSMDKMAKIGGAAYLLGACASTLTGWLSDRWIASGATPSLVRKTVVGGGSALAGIFVGLAAVSGPGYCIAALVLGVIFFGVTASNVWTITQALAGPKAAGRWAGFQCFIGNLSGIVAPAVTGFVLQRTGHFFWAFVIVTGVALVGAASWFLFVGPLEQVAWRGKLDMARGESTGGAEISLTS
jgi:ACS family D-galactonate transporter-like MFS transporter